MQPSHTVHHDSALDYSDLDLGFGTDDNPMVFAASLNMLSDNQHESTPFDFESTHIKQEDDAEMPPPSPTSFSDEMDMISSPENSNSSSSSTGSILDQLSHTNNNNNVNNHVMPHHQTGYWNYSQHPSRVVNQPVMPSFVAPPTFPLYPAPNMYMTELVTYPQPMGYAYVENAFPVPHFVPVPQYATIQQQPPPPHNLPQQQRKNQSPEIDDDEELLEMDDEEFQDYVTKFCACDTEAFEELNSRRNKVIDELKSLEQELHKTRDEALRSYEQLLGNTFDEQTKQEKLNTVREKVELSIQEVRKHAESKLRQMVSSAHKKRQNRKLPDKATSILQQWFLDNAKYPYPSVEEKNRLQKETQLTLTQINNWLINKRGRALKPIREKIVQQTTKK